MGDSGRANQPDPCRGCRAKACVHRGDLRVWFTPERAARKFERNTHLALSPYLTRGAVGRSLEVARAALLRLVREMSESDRRLSETPQLALALACVSFEAVASLQADERLNRQCAAKLRKMRGAARKGLCAAGVALDALLCDDSRREWSVSSEAQWLLGESGLGTLEAARRRIRVALRHADDLLGSGRGSIARRPPVAPLTHLVEALRRVTVRRAPLGDGTIALVCIANDIDPAVRSASCGYCAEMMEARVTTIRKRLPNYAASSGKIRLPTAARVLDEFFWRQRDW